MAHVAIFPGTVALRPQMSDSGEAVIRDNLGRITTFKTSGFVRVVADGSNGFTSDTGNRPGISTDSTAIAFSGNRNSAGVAIYASVTPTQGPPILVPVAGGPVVEPSGGIFSNFTSEQRVAVYASHVPAIPTGTRDEFTVFFQGSRNGVSGIYARAITVVNGQLEPLSAPVELIKVGGQIPSCTTATVTGFTLYRPLNRIGRFAFTVTLSDGTTAIVAGALAQKNPVIFVPGIGGSTLVDLPPDGDEVWLGPLSNRLRLTCFHPQAGCGSASSPPCSLEDMFWSPRIEATDAIRFLSTPVGHISTGTYGPLLNYLKSKGYRQQEDLGFPRTSNGCERAQRNDDPNLNPDLFVFAYDWRKDNHANAEKLGEYVQCVEQFYPDTKVDIVAHSMGGVLARRYLLRNPANHNVEKLITIATPWLGAPKALHVLETGEFIREGGIPIAAGPDIKAIAPSLTGAHQLLPSRAYQSLGGAPILVEDGWDIDKDDLYRETYDYDRVIEFLNERYPEKQQITAVGEAADTFHSFDGQDDWRLDTTGVKYFHFYGVQSVDQTIETVVATTELVAIPNQSLHIDNFTLEPSNVLRPVMKSGDGTVPARSAGRSTGFGDFNAPNAKVFLITNSDPDLVEHTGLTTNPEVQSGVLAALKGESNFGTKRALSATDEAVSAPSYYISIIGGASFVVRDTQGNNTAPITGDLLGTVPGVATFFMGENAQEVALPVSTEETYSITFRSVGKPLSIKILKGVGNVAPTDAFRYMDLALPGDVAVQLEVTPEGVNDLCYNSDADGTFETCVAPTLALSGSSALDLTPPRLSFSETVETQTLTHVTITATDNASNVHDLSYSINGVDFQPYTATLDLDPSETPFVYAFATDNAGNRAPLITYALNAPPITITGEVKNEDGIAIAGVTLSLSGAQSATTQTDAIGNYACPAVAPGGNYVLSATMGSLLFRPQDQEINNPDANLILNFNSFTPDAAGAINATWNAGPGNWATAANWNPSINFPNNGNGGFTYTATFNLGFNDAQAITDAVGVTIDQNITIQRFTLLGGIVTGDFNLTVLDNLAWSGYGGLLGNWDHECGWGKFNHQRHPE